MIALVNRIIGAEIILIYKIGQGLATLLLEGTVVRNNFPKFKNIGPFLSDMQMDLVID